MGSDPAGRLIIGAMSGTSADGVDVALVRVTGRGLNMRAELVRHHHLAYDAALRASIFAIRSSGETKLADLAQLGRQITLAYANATNELLRQSNVKSIEVAAIAAHGQTLYHDPPNTIQWFDPSLLAAETKIAVVSDFRRADCAAGGQGAPLVPFADYILFRHATKNRVLLNIGGIANLTYLPAGGTIEDVIAFDTGPGNCLSDHIMRERGGGKNFDAGGAIALRGVAHTKPVLDFVQSAYVSRRPPKSTDAPTMIEFYEKIRPRDLMYSLAHELATAVAIVSTTIVASLEFLKISGETEWIVSGGGVRNAAIMQHISKLASAEGALLADDFGIPSETKEAVAFALLGAATLDREPSNVQSATGANRRVVLGSITPKQ